jgi:hypothetical protein
VIYESNANGNIFANLKQAFESDELTEVHFAFVKRVNVYGKENFEIVWNDGDAVSIMTRYLFEKSEKEV